MPGDANSPQGAREITLWQEQEHLNADRQLAVLNMLNAVGSRIGPPVLALLALSHTDNVLCEGVGMLAAYGLGEGAIRPLLNFVIRSRYYRFNSAVDNRER